MNEEWLLGKTLNDLEALTKECGMPKYTARQITTWLYDKKVDTISRMSDISLKNRELLEQKYKVGFFNPLMETVSTDGTKKYLFPTVNENRIETAYIPDKSRATLCVSSQSGCKMGCLFCMTGRQGFQNNLSSGEILNQINRVPDSSRLTNIVYMGMGEPLDNTDEVLKSIEILTSEWGFGWSPARITLSTIGVIPGLRRFLNESKAHLAISLHSPFPEERLQIMPVEKVYPLYSVLSLLREYDFTHQRRVSFEYIVFKGINDTPAHVREMSRILNGIKCRVNLIRFHNVPGSPYSSPDEKGIIGFRDALNKKGIMTTIRSSRGEDIQAACGLLSTADKT